MQPSVDELDRLCQLFRDSDFDELVLQTEAFHIELRRAGMTPMSAMAQAASEQSVTVSDPPSSLIKPDAVPNEVAPAVQSSTGHLTGSGDAIRAGVGGVFYRAASPTSDAFVEVGSTVKAGDTLGLIEVMKLFTSVIADKDGVVEAVLVENGMAVQEGDALFRLRSDS